MASTTARPSDRITAPEDRWRLVDACLGRDDRRAWEALTTVGTGLYATRGLGEAGGGPSWPMTLAGGVYDGSQSPTLLFGPIWTDIDLDPPNGWRERVEFDLRESLLRIVLVHPDVADEVTVTRWASATAPGVFVQEVRGARGVFAPVEVRCPAAQPGATADGRSDGDVELMVVRSALDGRSLALATHDVVCDDSAGRCITRIAAVSVGTSTSAVRRARELLDAVLRDGAAALRRRHRREWDRRWTVCGSEIRDPVVDLGVRFSTAHLAGLGAVPAQNIELAIGARGLTGTSYRGHVFWDTDVFVVPVLSAIAPAAAAAALRYRARRMPAALRAAREEGRRGARFPWESAASGRDVTPTSWTDLDGNVVPIRTGELEVHIVADIAWSIWNHHRWSGDDAFMRAHGNRILVETARYWASRVEVDVDGSAHVRHVIGPDEYHVDVDDNAFTNVMARHNLRIAADVGGVDPTEAHGWLHLADRLVDGFDPGSGVYEQFAGFDELEATSVASLGEPPLSADALFGAEFVAGTQISKQPDVLMAYHLVPHEMSADHLADNIDRYLPFTAAGSSLAPAICASLLARVGRVEDARRWFEIAARLDLDDLTGTTPGGLHLATMGGLWQALTRGFLGVEVVADGLSIDPRIPAEWGRTAHRFLLRGRPVSIEVDGDEAVLDAPAGLAVRATGETRSARRHHLIRRRTNWEHR